MTEILSLENLLDKLSISTSANYYNKVLSQSLPVKAPFPREIRDGAVPTFIDHRTIGWFQISGGNDKSYLTSSSLDSIPHSKLISTDRFSSLVGADTGIGYRKARYQSMHVIKYNYVKQNYFMQWLLDNNYFEQSSGFKKPNFISFGGRISDSLTSPKSARGSFQIYATKFNDCIFLWDERPQEVPLRLESYFGMRFEQLLTLEGAYPTCASLPGPDETAKTYLLNEVTFGSHQLLVVNEVDGEMNGEPVEIKLFKEAPHRAMVLKHTKAWAQCVVPGIEDLVIGKRTGCGIVKDVVTTTLEGIVKKYQLNVEDCLDFENRFLSWIKNCFTEDEENDNVIDKGRTVKLFYWNDRQPRVQVRSNIARGSYPVHLLPEWFVKEIQKD